LRPTSVTQNPLPELLSGNEPGAGLAEVERDLIKTRTLESFEHRRSTGGDLKGRRKSYTPQQAALVRRLRSEGESIRSVSKATGLSLATIDRIIKLSSAD
jgi:DNA invertase Pin-like site-specific DNA recombinase